MDKIITHKQNITDSLSWRGVALTGCAEIKNKWQSVKFIEAQGLNTFHNIILEEFDEQKIRDFFAQNSSLDLFSLRSMVKCGSPQLASFLSQQEILENAPKLQFFQVMGYRTAGEASKVLCGEIQLCTGNRNFDLIATLSSCNQKATARSATKPKSQGGDMDYNLHGSLLDDRKLKHLVNRIPGLNQMIDYVWENPCLMNKAFEFGLFSKPVGMKNENVAVFEVRTHY